MEWEVLIGVSGIAVLGFFLYGCFKTGGFICPACGKMTFFTRANRNRMRFGRLPCPRCGTLIEVDH